MRIFHRHKWVTNWTRLPFPNHLFFVRKCAVCLQEIYAVETALYSLKVVPEVSLDNPKVKKALLTNG